MTDQADELRRLMDGYHPHRTKTCRTIAVTSGKGGVGKTNIAVNLGLAMAEAGARVALFDADWGLSNADVLLGLSPTRDLRHVLSGALDMEQILCDGPLGLILVPGASGIADLANLAPEQRDRLVSEVSCLANRIDIMVMDTAPGINDGVMDLATGADEALIVTTPEPTSLTDAYAFAKIALQRRPDAPISLVINMVTDRQQAEDVARGFSSVAERFLGRSIALAGFVCMDSHVAQAVHMRSPFLISHPRSVAANCVRRLGRDLLCNGIAPATTSTREAVAGGCAHVAGTI